MNPLNSNSPKLFLQEANTILHNNIKIIESELSELEKNKLILNDKKLNIHNCIDSAIDNLKQQLDKIKTNLNEQADTFFETQGTLLSEKLNERKNLLFQQNELYKNNSDLFYSSLDNKEAIKTNLRNCLFFQRYIKNQLQPVSKLNLENVEFISIIKEDLKNEYIGYLKVQEATPENVCLIFKNEDNTIICGTKNTVLVNFDCPINEDIQKYLSIELVGPSGQICPHSYEFLQDNLFVYLTTMELGSHQLSVKLYGVHTLDSPYCIEALYKDNQAPVISATCADETRDIFNCNNNNTVFSVLPEDYRCVEQSIVDKSNENNYQPVNSIDPDLNMIPSSNYTSVTKLPEFTGFDFHFNQPNGLHGLEEEFKSGINISSFSSHYSHQFVDTVENNSLIGEKQSILSEYINRNISEIPLRYISSFGQTGNKADNLMFPIGCVADGMQNVYVCDTKNHCVKIFNKDTQLKHIIKEQKFRRPSAIIFNSQNDFFVKDDHLIYAYDSNANFKFSFGSGQLQRPFGLSLLSDDRILVFDEGYKKSAKILIFSADGQKCESYPEYEPMPIRNLCSKCRFIETYEDRLYVVDLGMSQVYISSIIGQSINKFGSYGSSYGSFNEPSGITKDSAGNIIIADSKNNRIQLFTKDGAFKAIFKLDYSIQRPSDIFYHEDSQTLYVSNYLKHTIVSFKVMPLIN